MREKERKRVREGGGTVGYFIKYCVYWKEYFCVVLDKNNCLMSRDALKAKLDMSN